MTREPVAGTSVLTSLDAAAARRWAVLTRGAFAGRRAEIDALNVFPVPDGDTGTNLYLTFDNALDTAVTSSGDGDGDDGHELARQSQAFARALLLTARGNSGVILSQIFRGFADEIAASGLDTIGGAGLARALRRADDLAWASVHAPVEGTILSVSRAAAAAGESADDDLYAVTTAVLAAAREALARTPSQLPALARAGVVDAGGAGYVLLLEALDRVVRTDLPAEAMLGVLGDDALRRRPGWTTTVPDGATPDGAATDGAPTDDGAARGDAAGVPTSAGSTPEPHAPGADLGPGGPAYEVMYLLDGSDATRIATLRSRLDALGDSLLVVGGDEGLWNVHVHVDDVGAAVEAGIEAGRPHRIRVTHFASAPGGEARGRSDRPPPGSVAVVACAAGEGLASIFGGAGATVVVSGPRRRASAGQLLDAVRATGAACVLLLPNDTDTVLAAGAAADVARDEGVIVRVVGARTAVQGLAALAVFDPGADLAENAVSMGSAAAATRHGAVTLASRDALTSAGWCHPGDALGVVDGDVAVVGTDLEQVATGVVERLLGSGGELLTLVVGQDAPPGLGEAVESAARARRRDLEVSRVYGGQDVYPLLLGVE